MAFRFKFKKGSSNSRNKFLLGRKKSLRRVMVFLSEPDEDDPWLLKRLTTKEKRIIQQQRNNARKVARNQ